MLATGKLCHKVFRQNMGKAIKIPLKIVFILQNGLGLHRFRFPYLRWTRAFQARPWCGVNTWQAVRREKTEGWDRMERGGQDKEEAGGGREGKERKRRRGSHKKGQKEVERGKSHTAGAQGKQAGLYTESWDTHHMFPSDPTGALGCTDGSIRWRKAD